MVEHGPRTLCATPVVRGSGVPHSPSSSLCWLYAKKTLLACMPGSSSLEISLRHRAADAPKFRSHMRLSECVAERGTLSSPVTVRCQHPEIAAVGATPGVGNASEGAPASRYTNTRDTYILAYPPLAETNQARGETRVATREWRYIRASCCGQERCGGGRQKSPPDEMACNRRRVCARALLLRQG